MRIGLSVVLIGVVALSTMAEEATTRPSPASKPSGYILQPLGGDPKALRFTESREPARDVIITLHDKRRTIKASKWMGSNVAYYIAEDVGVPVESRANVVGDFDYDLTWTLGDVNSINAALQPYGLELKVAEAKPATTTRVRE